MGLWGLGNLGPLARTQKESHGPGPAGLPLGPHPYSDSVSGLLGACPCCELGRNAGLPPCPILLGLSRDPTPHSPGGVLATLYPNKPSGATSTGPRLQQVWPRELSPGVHLLVQIQAQGVTSMVPTFDWGHRRPLTVGAGNTCASPVHPTGVRWVTPAAQAQAAATFK